MGREAQKTHGSARLCASLRGTIGADGGTHNCPIGNGTCRIVCMWGSRLVSRCESPDSHILFKLVTCDVRRTLDGIFFVEGQPCTDASERGCACDEGGMMMMMMMEDVDDARKVDGVCVCEQRGH